MTYSDLIQIPSFIDRYNALRLGGKVGEDTFGYSRFLNQKLYNTPEWRKARQEVILRDNGFDLAHKDFPINGRIYVHHINPITMDDLINHPEKLVDPENLITTTKATHNAIHYGAGYWKPAKW